MLGMVQRVYSNLFRVHKKEGVQPILDLKRLNTFVWVRKFKMKSVQSMVAALHQGDFLTLVDIKDAYLHGPICPSHQCFLRVAIDGAFYSVHSGCSFISFVFSGGPQEGIFWCHVSTGR